MIVDRAVVRELTERLSTRLVDAVESETVAPGGVLDGSRQLGLLLSPGTAGVLPFAFVNRIWPTLILRFGPPVGPTVLPIPTFAVSGATAGAKPSAAAFAARLGEA